MFHHEFKLRTVIWEFGGEPIPEALRVDVAQLVDRGLPEALAELLDHFERDALRQRERAVVEAECFPGEATGRRSPWPHVWARHSYHARRHGRQVGSAPG